MIELLRTRGWGFLSGCAPDLPVFRPGANISAALQAPSSEKTCKETRAAGTNQVMNASISSAQPLAAPAAAVESRRYAVVTGVVALWMLLGWTLGLSANAYLLLGIPLLWLFQSGVARDRSSRCGSPTPSVSPCRGGVG